MTYEYLHEEIEARAPSDEKVAYTDGDNRFSYEGKKEVRSNYDSAMVTGHLAARGAEGWDLVQMEPHWSHYIREFLAPGIGYGFTHPSHIVRWYLTFRRAAD